MTFTITNRKRKVLWEPNPVLKVEELVPLPEPVAPEPPTQHTLVIPEGSRLIVQPQRRAYKKRVGNGHKSTKTRDLMDSDRVLMRDQLFFPQNGQIDDDDCLTFKDKLPEEVAVFQITGYISVLHRYVAEGRIQVMNLEAYEQWMSSKYGGSLWARYNDSKFVAVRIRNQEAVANGEAPSHHVTESIQISTIPRFSSSTRPRGR